ncbi:endonuclease V [Thermococcus sp. 21S9]|uniref:endonuclease V n=1 Tax=Thermococcus sp. 21S9 TaxID=1638223 RepID=UPI00143953BD|nr:endonuclease V [Thermococcus sp. 21S9]NJE55308.1 endonuclease V [Thermococcus sp. 21S9]
MTELTNYIITEKLKKIAKAQARLSKRIVERPLDLSRVKTVGAVDVSYRGNDAVSVLVICTFPECEPIETRTVRVKVTVPYIPTYFFLRETMPVLRVVKNADFDVLLVEGHGKAHPRRYGLASHIGLILGRPVIGVAKRPLRGVPENLYERVGKAYVSVGHLVDLRSAVEIVKALGEGYPKPLRIADKLSKVRR